MQTLFFFLFFVFVPLHLPPPAPITDSYPDIQTPPL